MFISLFLVNDLTAKSQSSVHAEFPLAPLGIVKLSISFSLFISTKPQNFSLKHPTLNFDCFNNGFNCLRNDFTNFKSTDPETSIDVSGSVDLKLVKSFLRQLKPLLKQSKLRVGCFNEKFWGFVDIKSEKDIDNFTIPRGARGNSAWTEDWDLAVRSFTKKREINKIVFTDGYPCPGTMPKEDLKRENIIWLVYGNKDFKPCCGKVINITEKQLEQLHQVDKSISMEDMSR